LKTFGWDNEYPERAALVAPFLVDTIPVTNANYLEFAESGGYQNRALWDDESWAWKERRRPRAPIVWSTNNKSYFYRTVFEDL
jgi:gamma-glutamyl hercynylcysteine S-oxide synthase